MDCPDCGQSGGPYGRTFELEEAFGAENPDVAVSRKQYVQLECGDCGAVVGYLGVAAAVGADAEGDPVDG